jgi:molybdenum cofactor cytidylyltransferase
MQSSRRMGEASREVASNTERAPFDPSRASRPLRASRGPEAVESPFSAVPVAVIQALVLAAGASTRMGTPKAGVVVPGTTTTFLDHLVQTLLRAGLPGVTIVTGARPDLVRNAWTGRDRRVGFVHNEAWAEGQLRSLQRGLRALESHELEAVLVALVDVPLVAAGTVQQLVSAWRRTGAPIVRPARGSDHGHPVIFDRSLFDELKRADPAAGAKPIVRARAPHIVDVPVTDEGAFRDFDTPADLADFDFGV